MDLLDIQGLVTRFPGPGGGFNAVDGLSLRLRQGRILGLVGESGCGKTMTALSILDLVPHPGYVAAGRILFEGRDLRALPADEMRRIRGSRIAMIFQEPMTALNPVLTIGEQIAEILTTHRKDPKRAALAAAVDLLHDVGIPSPEKRVREYPHQLSGGMRQRVMIAMAISCRPALILADEPTTALDVTIQAHILELLGTIQQEMGMALVLVTHDLGLIAERAHEVAVMYAGRIVEQADTMTLFADPRHPYTRGLMASIPRPTDEVRKRLSTIPGSVPSLGDLPAGCTFRPRCGLAYDACAVEPDLRELKTGHLVRCWKA